MRYKSFMFSWKLMVKLVTRIGKGSLMGGMPLETALHSVTPVGVIFWGIMTTQPVWGSLNFLRPLAHCFLTRKREVILISHAFVKGAAA
jgi:hypothetical protein